VATNADGTYSFINRVSDAHQPEEPDQFYGGIVADPMGFGKTLTMIALAATDHQNPTSPTFSKLNFRDEAGRAPDYASPQTLIIVPPSRTSSSAQCS
jgi:SNF2 family DNA or RNA helicase